MTDEEKKKEYKISIPVMNNFELAELDNNIVDNYNNIIQEISKAVSKDKDIIILQAIIKHQDNLIQKQQKEIEQEKGKNKELTDFIEAIEELKQAKKPITDLVYEMNKFEDEFISKDKIKEKIKELEDECDNSNAYDTTWYEASISTLKELLE